jgi:hypothetical protein
MTQIEKLFIQSQNLKKVINGKDWVSFDGIKSLLLPRMHKKFTDWQTKGLTGIMHNGERYISINNFNNFLNGKIPDNNFIK